MAVFKKRVPSPQINLSASMDQRTNNEVLNIGDEAQRLIAYNLENADLFNTASIQTRNGTEDLSCGIINYTFDNTCVYNTASGLSVSGSTLTNKQIPWIKDGVLDYPVWVFIPPSGQNLTLKEANLTIQSIVTSGNYATLVASGQSAYDMIVEAHLFKLDQFPSGVSTFGNGVIGPFDISISGSAWGAIYPAYSGMAGSNMSIMPSGVIPVATAQTIVNLGDYTQSGTNYYTAKQDIELEFSAPAFVSSGTVYGVRFDMVHTSGTIDKATYFDVVMNTGTDIDPSSVLLEEFYYGGAPANQTFAIRRDTNLASPTWKPWPIGSLCFQNAVGFLNPDYKTASKSIAFPIEDAYLAGNPSPFSEAGLTAPVAIGQTLNITSGMNIFGSYAYFGPNKVAGSLSYKADGTVLSGTQNVGIFSRLYDFTNNLNPTLLTTASGNIVLDYDQNVVSPQGTKNIYTNVDMNLEKVYFIWDNPVTLTSGTYLLTFGLYDYNTGGAYGDYVFTFGPPNSYFQSAVRIGVETQSGTNYVGDVMIPSYSVNAYGTMSNEYSNVYSPNEPEQLTCGLITTLSGNATTLIYDYRVGSDLNQKVIIGQRDKLYWTEFSDPCKTNYTVIHSGAAIQNDALWSALTFNDLLFAHQYAQSDGQVWDSTYSGVSYNHGKRPTFTASGVTTAGSTLPSGTYNILLATAHDSGGFRASEISGVTIASGQWIHVGGLNMQSQYPFDLATQSTYIFMTENSGNTYYAATLYDAASLSPNILPQPIANNITNAYINTPIIVSGTGANNSVLNALDPSYPQTYLTNQIDTPRFKKIAMYNNYMFGLGDPDYPSKLYYSDILAPQIWSFDGQYGGSYDIYPDNGQDLTAMEVNGQFLMLFKKNSTYRLEYTENDEIPFAVVQISPNIGALGVFTTVNTEKGIFGLSQYGPFVCSPNSIDIIGQEILPWFKELNHDDLTFSVAVHDQVNQVITWSIANNDANQDRNFALVFNYKENSWSVRRGQTWNCAGIIRDEDNFDQIWIGDSLGTVKRDNVSNTDSDLIFNDGNTVQTTRAIEMVIETPWMSFNGAKGSDSDKFKLFRFAIFNVETAINSNLTIDVYYDYETSPRYTRILPIGTGSSNKRINLGGQGKIVKFKIYNTGEPNKIKINKILLEYQALGSQEPSA